MARFDYFLIGCTLLLLVGNCATPRVVPSVASTSPPIAEQSIQPNGNILAKLKQAERLYTVGNSILLANADLCGENVAPWYGFYGGDLSLYDGEWREALKAAYGLSDEPTVLADVVVSPVFQAGLRRGDIIKAVNGTATRSGGNATENMLAQLAQASRGGFVDLTFERKGQLETVRVPKKYKCNYNITFEDSDKLNSYAEGKNIVLSSGMISFASRDEELAMIVAHELAHDTIKRQRAEDSLLGGEFGELLSEAASALGNIISRETLASTGSMNDRFSAKDEHDADYVTMYFLARAGVRTKPELANFWSRIAEAGPWSIDRRFGHPGFPERSQTIQNTISEINAKRQSGAPLVPTPYTE